jgi:hypothetical protein
MAKSVPEPEIATGDLVRHVYTGAVGVLLKTRMIDLVYDPAGLYPVFDAYVLFVPAKRTWVPLEHLKKLTEEETN